jgi:hypothetical protein
VFWLFAMAATVGVIMATPLLFQARTGAPSQRPPVDEATGLAADRQAGLVSFAAFALAVGGLGGIFALGFRPTDLVAFAVAVCLGLAAGAMHPEFLGALHK